MQFKGCICCSTWEDLYCAYKRECVEVLETQQIKSMQSSEKTNILEDLSAYSANHPIITNMVIAGLLMALGDYIAQVLEARTKVKPKQADRTLRLAMTNAFVLAPMSIAWYSFLDSLELPLLFAVALDQCIWGAITNTTFFTVTKILEGHSLMVSLENARINVPKTLRTAFLIWPFVQIINLSLVPLEYRLVVMNIVNIPWSAYLSLQAASSK